MSLSVIILNSSNGLRSRMSDQFVQLMGPQSFQLFCQCEPIILEIKTLLLKFRLSLPHGHRWMRLPIPPCSKADDRDRTCNKLSFAVIRIQCLPIRLTSAVFLKTPILSCRIFISVSKVFGHTMTIPAIQFEICQFVVCCVTVYMMNSQHYRFVFPSYSFTVFTMILSSFE